MKWHDIVEADWLDQMNRGKLLVWSSWLSLPAAMEIVARFALKQMHRMAWQANDLPPQLPEALRLLPPSAWGRSLPDAAAWHAWDESGAAGFAPFVIVRHGALHQPASFTRRVICSASASTWRPLFHPAQACERHICKICIPVEEKTFPRRKKQKVLHR